jgi:poly [ADP-ribose] polymerase
MHELLNLVWDVDAIKIALKSMNLDANKLPLGQLKIERIRKAHSILKEIQKYLPIDRSKEQRVADLTKDFYQMLPHDFGMKRAQNIDHVLRVKDKIKMLESLNDILVCE